MKVSCVFARPFWFRWLQSFLLFFGPVYSNITRSFLLCLSLQDVAYKPEEQSVETRKCEPDADASVVGACERYDISRFLFILIFFNYSLDISRKSKATYNLEWRELISATPFPFILAKVLRNFGSL